MFPIQQGVHLRIMLQEEALPRLFLPYIIDRKDSYGCDTRFRRRDSVAQSPGRKRVIVEFSSPNLASDFQGKHLRSTVQGDFIARLHEATGWDVIRMNYLNDWGKSIALLGVGWERFGAQAVFDANPIGHLTEVHQRINALFEPELAASRKARSDALHGRTPENGKTQAQIESEGLFAERDNFLKRMEGGEEKALAFQKYVRDVSIKDYAALYRRLGIHFDDYSGESCISPDTMTEIEEMVKSKGLCEERDGQLIVELKKYKLNYGKIRDRSGSRTYLLRDLAAVLERLRKYAFDKMIYVVAADHKVQFSQVTKIFELLDMSHVASKLQHVFFNETSKMVEEFGEGHCTLDAILARCTDATREALKLNQEKAATMGDTEETVASVGVSAIKAQELSARRAREQVFDVSHMVSFESGTGPTLRWWYSMLSDAVSSRPNLDEISDEDWGSMESDSVFNLLRLLVQWPNVVQSVCKELDPTLITGYLEKVTMELSEFVKEDIGSKKPTEAQIMLFEAVRVVLGSGLGLLGILPGLP